MACIASLIDPSKNKVVKTWAIDENYKTAESFVKKFDKKGVISLDPNTLEIQNNAQKFISNIERS